MPSSSRSAATAPSSRARSESACPFIAQGLLGDDAGEERLGLDGVLSDEAHKLVLSRLGDRLRIAGTAELNGYDTSINQVRCEAIVKRVMDLFPDAGDPSKATYWAGLRPATPSNIPCVERTKYPNLFLNTGHGTLVWSACRRVLRVGVWQVEWRVDFLVFAPYSGQNNRRLARFGGQLCL
jgi:hypothetical protein